MVETRRKTLARKEAVVEMIKEKLTSSQAAFLVDFSGIGAEDMVVLRRMLKDAKSELKVVKNTLAIRASEGTSLSDAPELFRGSTAMVFGYHDPVETAKILVKFAQEVESLQLKGSMIEGRLYGAEDIRELSKLPNREILLATLLMTLSGPMSGLVNVLAANMRGLLNVLNSIADKKEKEV
jgi:large subunit ribosomal protein L10